MKLKVGKTSKLLVIIHYIHCTEIHLYTYIISNQIHYFEENHSIPSRISKIKLSQISTMRLNNHELLNKLNNHKTTRRSWHFDNASPVYSELLAQLVSLILK